MKSTDVVVVMGSQSDFNVMKAASEILKKFKISHEVMVVSAHRTPHLLEKSVAQWESSGVKIIIAGAGGAAHLPGMLASFSILPVIGVPIKSKSLSGLDSLLSIVQMPKGVPVATVGVDNAANAGLLAVKILKAVYASEDGDIKKEMQLGVKLKKHKSEMNKAVKVMQRNISKKSKK